MSRRLALHPGTRHRKPPGAVAALAVLLALPLLATAGPATAATRAVPSRPAAARPSDALVVVSNLLARLFPAPLPPAPPLAPEVQSQVMASTVKVSGTACGVRLHGSGFSPAPDTIVTNAHVVAGAKSTQVLRPDGRTLPAQVQVFDSVRDLAVLNVPGLGEPALDLASAVPGETGAVFGHPRGQAAVEVSPARVVRRVSAEVGDIYDRPAPPRQIVVLDADLEPGDSGAPLVNASGQVVGVAFAVASFRQSTAFAIASEELPPVLAQPRGGPVSTGPCIA